mmetsp:Transcript_161385/g.518156  ORF Transcript_161385/g.518156 Transcript_161385/m.518156 type:complete len:87 (-) Transcript_161385:252-512(-)
MVCTKCEKKLGKLVSPPPPPFSVAIPVILRALSDVGFSLTTCHSSGLVRRGLFLDHMRIQMFGEMVDGTALSTARMVAGQLARTCC